ncbi:hypothetical protein PGB90_005189 [Kerria lacca]
MCNNGGFTEIPIREFSPFIEYLSLSKNNISRIMTESFMEFKHLRKLSLDGNNITRIERFAFKGLSKLRELSIQQTSLSKLERFSFSGLQNVTAILLSHNRIKLIEESSFAGSSNIRIILLDHNPIHVIHSKAFANLRHVEYLILPSGIRSIQPDAFNGLDSVGLIKLPFMDLEFLEPYTFRGLNQVHLLSIQESDLGVIRSKVFKGLTSVGSLNIINNKIDYVQELKITRENKIKILRLLGNHLLQSPAPGTVEIQVSENFTVVGNHFPCNCQIHSVLEGPLGNGTSYNFLLKNYCISPLELNGKAIIEMNLDNVAKCANTHNVNSWDATVSMGCKHFVKLYACSLLLIILMFY